MGLLVVLAASGCVRRRLMIRSNPVGALVYVDNVEVGTTPCAVNYTYYGTREIRLVKDGYETLTVNQPLPTPWYEIPPLDLVSETMIPREIRDERTVSYTLSPQMIVPTDRLLARAEELRGRTQGRAAFAAGPLPAGSVPFPGTMTLPPGGQILPSPGELPGPPSTIPRPSTRPPRLGRR